MTKTTVTVLLVITLCSTCVFAEQPVVHLNFTEMYRANEAEKLLAAEKYEQAHAAYAKLASDTSHAYMEALAGARAAVALGLQEDKYEEGLAQARAIEDRARSVQAQIELMYRHEDFAKLVDTFRDEDIAAWPRRTLPQQPRVGRPDLRALALFDRGRAFLEIGDAEAAARDIQKACEFADARHHKLNLLSFLARNVYQRALKDDARTFETDMRIVELDAGYAATFRAAVTAAAYLREQERYDEAMEILNRYEWRAKKGFWFVSFANAVGQTHFAAGRFAEAADVYRRFAQADEKAGIKARGAAMLQWARSLAAAGDAEAAGNVYRKLIEQDDMPESYRQQAEEALADLTQPAADGPES